MSDDRTPEMSDKAAKEYKDATESIERAASVGTYTQLLSLVGMLMKFASDPRIEVVMKFFGLFIKFFDAAASEDAAATAEALFTDENITWLQKIAEAFYEMSAAGGSLQVSINRVVEDLPQATKAINDFAAEILKLTKPLRDATTEIQKTNTELGRLTKAMKAIKDIDLSDWFEELLDKLEG